MSCLQYLPSGTDNQTLVSPGLLPVAVRIACNKATVISVTSCRGHETLLRLGPIGKIKMPAYCTAFSLDNEA